MENEDIITLALLGAGAYFLYSDYKNKHPEANLPSGSPTDIMKDTYNTYTKTARENPNFNLFDAAKNAFNSYVQEVEKQNAYSRLQTIAQGGSKFVDLGAALTTKWTATAPALNAVILPNQGSTVFQDKNGGLYSDISNFIAAPTAAVVIPMANEVLTFKGYTYTLYPGETRNFVGDSLEIRRKDGTIREVLTPPPPEPNKGSAIGGSSTNLVGAEREAARIARTRGLK